MSLEYSLTIEDRSEWKFASPNEQARNLPFFLNEWGHYVAKSAYYTKRADVNMCLMFFTLGGRGKLKHHGETVLLKPNSIVLISCKEEHEYSTSGDVWDFRWVYFYGTAADEYCRLANPAGVQTINSDRFQEYLSILDMIDQYAGLQDVEQLLLVSELLTQLCTKFILEQLRKNKKADIAKGKLKQLLDYMQNNMSQKINLADLAEQLYLSKYHFSRTFKSLMGVTPHEYLTLLRVNKAKELLITTDYNLSRIAEITGFSDSKNLLMHFKRITSITPGEYRKIRR